MVQITTIGEGLPTDARTALILPGVNYTAQAPLLYWSVQVLLAAGWRVRVAEWDEGDRAHATPWELIDHVFTLEGAAGTDLVVAKSLGTLALPHCIRAGIAGVWLTPLLDQDKVAAALRSADRRHLAIGGTNDRHWIADAASGTDADIFTVDGADHALLAEDWRESMRIAAEVAERVAQHVQRSA